MNDLAIGSKGLTKAYGDIRAVDEINLTVPRGAIYGFLGRNGAGKTTTIKMLLGLARPTAGSAHVLGMDVRTERISILRRTAFVSEKKTLYPSLTPSDLSTGHRCDKPPGRLGNSFPLQQGSLSLHALWSDGRAEHFGSPDLLSLGLLPHLLPDRLAAQRSEGARCQHGSRVRLSTVCGCDSMALARRPAVSPSTHRKSAFGDEQHHLDISRSALCFCRAASRGTRRSMNSLP